MIRSKMAKSARKALSLRQDGVFRLLVTMTAVLGLVAALGAASVTMLENVYGQWRLSQQSQISLYLLAESDPELLHQLENDLQQLVGVQEVRLLETTAVQELLTPYFTDDAAFPLPVVVDVTVDPRVDRDQFDAAVQQHFPAVEIDDARALLATVGQGVRFAQIGIVILALAMLGLMGILVIMTVRAGLLGQKRHVAVLQYIGGTDHLVALLITRQVFGRSLLGWSIACVLVAFLMLGLYAAVDVLRPFMTWQVWVSAMITPLLLPLIALAAAWGTANKVVRYG